MDTYGGVDGSEEVPISGCCGIEEFFDCKEDIVGIDNEKGWVAERMEFKG